MLIFPYQSGFVVKNLVIFKDFFSSPRRCSSLCSLQACSPADAMRQETSTSLVLLVITVEMTEYKLLYVNDASSGGDNSGLLTSWNR